MTAAVFNDTLAVGTHVFQVSPRVQTNIAVDDLGTGGAAIVEFTYDDRGKDLVLSGADFAADVAADEWAPGNISRASQTLRGPVTAVKITVTVATMKVVINSAAKVRATLFPATGTLHIGNKTPCAMQMGIAATGSNSVHHGAGAPAATMAQSATGRSGIKTGTGAVSMDMTLTSVGRNPVHHGVGAPAIDMAISGASADLKVHHGTASMPMELVLAGASADLKVHHGVGEAPMILTLAGVGSNPVHHGIGALAMGMGIASLSDGPDVPVSLPQQGNIVLRWNASDGADVWIDSAKNTLCADGEDCFKWGQFGTGGTINNADYGFTSSSVRPTYRTNGINGLGSLEFEDNDWGQCTPDPNGLDDNGAGNYTVLTVFAPGFTTGFKVLWNWGGGGPSFNPVMAFNAGLVRPGMNTFGEGSSASHSLDQELACIQSDDGSDAQVYRFSHDATNDTGSSTSKATPDPSVCTLGSQGQAPGDYIGLIGEIIAWSPALSASEMDDLEAWVTDKWGMSWS